MAKDTYLKKVNIKNRRASHEYHFLDTFTAGMVLQGTEIKSIRQGKVNMQEAYCYFKDGELWVKQMHITPYAQGNIYNHVSDRERKLLLQKRELRKLKEKSEEKGLTIIPVRLFISDEGYAKLDIALGKGKKLYDKREDLKAKDSKRELDRMKF